MDYAHYITLQIFIRSSKRNHKLNECYIIAIENLDNLSNQFGDLYETYSWQLVYPKMYCATRWMGLHTPCNTAIRSWIVLVILKEQLITDNYGSINEDDIDDDNDDEIVNEFESTLIEEDNTNCGNINASTSKRNKWSSQKIGITDAHWRLNSFVAALIQPVSVCVTRLQTTHQSIQHRISRQILKMERDIKR